MAIDLWDVVLEGWQRSSLTDKQWEQILMLLLDVNQTSSSALYATSRLLKEGTEKSPGGIPSSLSDLSMGLAEKTWSACVVLNHERGEESDDWVSPAINHPAGALVTFSLLMLSQLKKESGQDWKEIPVQHKKFFDFVLTGDSYSAELGRVLIASDLLFLFSLDEQWTANNVVPLLRWLKNPVEWSVRLPSAFPDVVDMIHASPAPKLEHSSIQRELLGSDLPTQYPDSVAKLVLYLLRNRLVPYDLAPVLDIIKKLAPYAVARQHLLAACQELAALGHPDARVLRDTIEGAGSG